MTENQRLSKIFGGKGVAGAFQRGGSNCAKSQNFRQSENHTSDLSGVTMNENEPLSNNFWGKGVAGAFQRGEENY